MPVIEAKNNYSLINNKEETDTCVRFKVLIIESDPHFVKYLMRKLDEDHVNTATSSNDAIKKIEIFGSCQKYRVDYLTIV